MAKTEIIEINGKKHPYYIGFNALRVYKQATGQDLVKQMQSGTMEIGTEEIIGLAYCGLVDGYRLANKKFELDIHGVADMLDEDVNSLSVIFEAVQKFPLFSGNANSAPKKK